MLSAVVQKLKPAPDAEPITDPQQIDQMYRYWRLRTLYACFIGYAVFYLCRRNIPLAVPMLREELDISRGVAGLIDTAMLITYGVGKFCNGILADRTNPRFLMALGLLLSAVANLLFGFTTAVFLLVFLFAMNGWFQSMGFPPGARLLSHWYSPSEYGRYWGIYGCSHQVGTAVIGIAGGYLVVAFGWQSVFYVPAIFALIITVFLLERLRDVPSSMGLPPVELWRKDVTDSRKLEALEQPMTVKETLLKHVLNNKFVWFVAFGNMFLYVGRYGINSWLPSMLYEYKQISIQKAGWLYALFELAGILGMLTAGWVSDKLFKARRGPVMATYMFILSFTMLGFWKLEHAVAYTTALALCGFLVYGPLMLVSVAAAGFAGKKAAASASGFTGLWGYIGGAFAGTGIGTIVDYFGWGAGYSVLVGASIMSALCFSLTWNVIPRSLAADVGPGAPGGSG
jgi:glycerol-3-phosphate transporter